MPYANTVEGQSNAAARYSALATTRDTILARLIKTTQLADPKLIPPENLSPIDALYIPNQSFGLRMMSNMVGAILMAAFPPDIPWAILESPEHLRQSMTPDMMREVEEFQFRRSMVVLDLLEQGAGSDSRPSPTRFRSGVRRLIRMSAGTGDALARIHEDGRWQVFPRRSYVTARDSCMEEYLHGTKEKKDVATLTPEQFEKTGLDDSILSEWDARKREKDLYTLCEYHHSSRKWVLQQSVNDRIIFEEDYGIDPYISAPYELIDGEDYGRGFIEEISGDLENFDFFLGQYKKILIAISRLLIINDPGSGVADDDLEAPDGEIISGLVRDGIPTGVTMLTSNKHVDLAGLLNGVQFLRGQLAKASLIESEMTPVKDRVTAFQVSRIMEEVAKATNGIGPTMSEHIQHQAFTFGMDLAIRRKLMPKMPERMSKWNRIVITTGQAALAQQGRIQRAAEILSASANILPEGMALIDQKGLMRRWLRYAGVFEPGAVKTDAQIEAETNAAIAQQTALAAGPEAAKAIGQIAVNALSPA